MSGFTEVEYSRMTEINVECSVQNVVELNSLEKIQNENESVECRMKEPECGTQNVVEWPDINGWRYRSMQTAWLT